MIIENRITKISKKLSYILRHNPKRFKVTLDEEGWADIDCLLNSLHNFKDLTDLKKEDLLDLISNQEKVRFVIKENKIKATHGHTIELKREYLNNTTTRYSLSWNISQIHRIYNSTWIIKDAASVRSSFN